jgi:hypothetical protein
MRLRRSGRRNLILLSTRPIVSSGVRPAARLARRRRFRFIRTGVLLAVIGVMRLAQITRSYWRTSLGLSGVLLEVLGHSVFTGPAMGAVGLLGLAAILVALLKSANPASGYDTAPPQAAWRWHG